MKPKRKNNMYAIETHNLAKKYKDTVAVDSLCLKIEKGELFSLLGVNGAGKTTTIKMLTCLLKNSGGDALVNGMSILTHSDKIKEIIGISPQETAVAPNLTVEENLKFICGIYGFSKEKTAQKTQKIIEEFSLSEVKNKRASRLSGGFQRRLSMAMAIICEPQILFLDEPTLGIDVISRSEIWDIIRKLKGEITIILTTHYMEEAEALSDRIGIMKNGRLIALGKAEELKNKANTQKFEDAFIKIVKGEIIC